MVLLITALLSCSTAREIVETETIVLSGTRHLDSASLRRRAAVSNNIHGEDAQIDDLEVTIEKIEQEIHDIEEDLAIN